MLNLPIPETSSKPQRMSSDLFAVVAATLQADTDPIHDIVQEDGIYTAVNARHNLRVQFTQQEVTFFSNHPEDSNHSWKMRLAGLWIHERRPAHLPTRRNFGPQQPARVPARDPCASGIPTDPWASSRGLRLPSRQLALFEARNSRLTSYLQVQLRLK